MMIILTQKQKMKLDTPRNSDAEDDGNDDDDDDEDGSIFFSYFLFSFFSF